MSHCRLHGVYLSFLFISNDCQIRGERGLWLDYRPANYETADFYLKLDLEYKETIKLKRALLAQPILLGRKL